MPIRPLDVAAENTLVLDLLNRSVQYPDHPEGDMDQAEYESIAADLQALGRMGPLF